MIDLYAANTPNGQRAAVFLEEMALPYNLTIVDLATGGAAAPEILALNPLARVPVIVDALAEGKREVVSQSWVIGLYLAEKTGLFLPRDAAGRTRVLEWLFHIGTDVMMVHSTLNQVTRFVPEKTQSTIAFYEQRLTQAFEKLDAHFGRQTWFGDEISVADLAFYPIYNYRREFLAGHPEFTQLRRWGIAMDERPGCRMGVSVIADQSAQKP